VFFCTVNFILGEVSAMQDRDISAQSDSGKANGCPR
jgi:hypothetical protein